MQYLGFKHKQIVHFNPLSCTRKPLSAQGRNGGKRDSEISLNLFTLFAKCHAIYDNNFIDETNVEKLGTCITYILICVNDLRIDQQDNASRNS